jgi:LysR family transcriptional regulator, mexEF-oprN operon transcriptional activator
VSQPTASGMLTRLRASFADALLIRNGRQLEPTVRALELVARIKPHLEGLLAAARPTQPFNPTSDVHIFKLGCTDATALVITAPLSRLLRHTAPKCDLVLRLGDYCTLPEMLSTGEINTALGYLRDAPSANTKIKVLRTSKWVMLSDASSKPIKGLDDYCKRPHVLLSAKGDLTGFVDESLATQGRKRRVAIGIPVFSWLPDTLLESDLIATVPDFVGADLAKRFSLRMQKLPLTLAPIKNALAWRAVVDQSPAEQWFRQQVTQIFQTAHSKV